MLINRRGKRADQCIDATERRRWETMKFPPDVIHTWIIVRRLEPSFYRPIVWILFFSQNINKRRKRGGKTVEN